MHKKLPVCEFLYAYNPLKLKTFFKIAYEDLILTSQPLISILFSIYQDITNFGDEFLGKITTQQT